MSGREKKFSFSERIKSFVYAFDGIIFLIRSEHNFRVHLFVLAAVVISGIFFNISLVKWMAILFVSTLVLVSESFNTSIESLSDAVSQSQDERIRKAKDIAAAAVLISAISAVITGLIIFIPELLKLFV